METQLPNIEKEISRIAESVKRLEEGGGRFIDLSRVPLICQSIVDIREDLKEIKQSIKDLDMKNETYVREKDFTFWRNLLVSGLLLSIAVGFIMNLVR